MPNVLVLIPAPPLHASLRFAVRGSIIKVFAAGYRIVSAWNLVVSSWTMDVAAHRGWTLVAASNTAKAAKIDFLVVMVCSSLGLTNFALERKNTRNYVSFSYLCYFEVKCHYMAVSIHNIFMVPISFIYLRYFEES